MTWLAAAGILAASILVYFVLRRFRRPAHPEFFEIPSAAVTIRGVRYPNPRRRPVVLVHGYSGNSRNWREMGYALQRAGFDVWMPNLRGHGRGDHRSTVGDSPHGYGFSGIVAEDLPQIVDHVVGATAMPVALVGHSMGGMASKAYVAGVRVSRKGRFYSSTKAARELARHKVRNLTVIGSPPHFRHLPALVRWVARTLPFVAERIQTLAPSPSSRLDPMTEPVAGPAERVRKRYVQALIRHYTRLPAARGVLEPSNFDGRRRELERLLHKGVSPVPGDLARDASRWARTGRILSEEGFDFGKPRKVYVPLLFIAGDRDGVGRAEDILDEARSYARLGRVRTRVVPDTSHVDLISGRRAARMVGKMVSGHARRFV